MATRVRAPIARRAGDGSARARRVRAVIGTSRAVRAIRRLSVVLAAHLLPILLAFAIGQAAAWCYLRTGRTASGLAATVLLWGALDWWLVERYVLAADDVALQWPATILFAVAAATTAALLFGRWRRRWSAAARERTARFANGLAAYLRSDYAAARTAFARLVRVDPWDSAAWIALGDVLARSGQPRRARACYRRAGAVDVTGAWRDLLQRRRARPG
jgi:tetratricopeptide (TPR) repeat protein